MNPFESNDPPMEISFLGVAFECCTGGKRKWVAKRDVIRIKTDIR